MWSAKSRIAVRLLAVAALAGLTAGCFQPMYAERSDGTPGLRDKLMGVELPPVDKANASREARIGVEIRNALAFKLYGQATGMPPTHKLVLHFSTSRSSLILDPNTALPSIRELRHRRPVQPGRPRHQQVGHDRLDLLAGVLRHPRLHAALRPQPAPSATPRIAPRRRSPKTSRRALRPISPPAPDVAYSASRIARPESKED